MTLVDACCNTPPTNAQWQPKGQEKVLLLANGEERKVYRTGPKDSKRGIVAIYDIFGYHPTSIQFFDRIAASNGGFQVAVPEIFKELMPSSIIGDMTAMLAWLREHGDYKKSNMIELIMAAVEDLRADGCTTFSIVGQCWGTYIALQAASEDETPFLAVGGPHPSVTNIETVKDVKCPLILLPSKDEADMIPVLESVKHKNFPVESFHKRFTTMHHGWTGGRGDWSDPEQLKAGIEAADLLGQYFAKVAEVSESKQ